MIFAGAIPKETISQLFCVFDFDAVKRVRICCSGSFRFEQALTKRYPALELYSNDVSLLSTSIGRYLSGDPLAFRFTGALSWLEDPLAAASPLERIAAVALAIDISRFRGASAFARSHMAHYRANLPHYLGATTEKIRKYLDGLKIADFWCGDFRTHAERAAKDGSLVVSWPPTIKSAYERDFRYVNANTEWERPEYQVFDPARFGEWLTEMKERGTRYCVMSDRLVEGHAPCALFTTGRAKRFVVYASSPRAASLSRKGTTGEPFRYRVIDTASLTAATKVHVVEVSKEHMNFVKDKYQLPGLVHTDGLYRFLVFLDGQLAGGFVYSWMRSLGFHRDPRVTKLGAVYLLSDFATSRQRKLSKLIAMLATGRDSIARFDRKAVKRTQWVLTSTFTGRHTSMKYRGIFELLSRRMEGKPCLNYLSRVRDGSNADIYAEWWRRYAANAAGAREASGPEGARGGA
jgi:hypothetical protein